MQVIDSGAKNFGKRQRRRVCERVVKVKMRGRNIFNGFLPAALFRTFRAKNAVFGAKSGGK
jgi:hypothetical protein